MKYMLDTNIIAYIRNSRPESVLAKFQQYDADDLCISVITLAELEYGIINSSDPVRNRIALLGLLSGISVLPFEGRDAEEYGIIRAGLRKQGKMIGANGLLIAAQARARGLTLVTNNTGEFERVNGLNLENWTF